MEMQPDLLNEIHSELYAEPAKTSQRFLNYLLDLIVFYVVAIGAQLLLASYVYPVSMALSYTVTYLLYVTYFTLFEALTQGRTLGKFATNTIVVKTDGSPITFYDAMVRSFCRIVPFEPFSAFGGHPWHDRWTDTKVIKIIK